MSAEPLEPTGVGRHVVEAGALAAERRLLAEVAARLPRSAADAALLARPIVVVVPSRELRRHVAARLVGERGGAVAAVRIVTLHALALAIVDRGGALHAGAQALPVLVARAVRGERELGRLVESLDDALPPLVAAVRDLLDAGADASHAGFLDDLLAEMPESDAGVRRARALVRVAGAVAAEVERLHLGVPAALLREAADALRRDPERALPARAVLVHGFADATGVATDLIEALVRRAGALVIRIAPPDPADPARPEDGGAFASAFRFRLASVAPAEAGCEAPAAPLLAAFRAPGVHAEVREVARRVRGLLERGVAPEAIGVVARDLEPYRVALAVHFERLAIPFATAGARPLATPASRRVAALVEVLGRGGEASVDAWLAAAAPTGAGRVDVRVGLRACGAVRVADVAGLALATVLGDAPALALPLRRGIEAVGGEDGVEELATVSPRRHLARRDVERTVAAAAAAVAGVRALPVAAPGAAHAAAVRALLAGPLAWGGDGADEVEEALARLGEGLPATLVLGHDEFVSLLTAELAEAGRAALGGEGGVRVMGVTAARGVTFAHLFVTGCNRDMFPRQVREDPLLPDRLRLALEPLLPDLPVKSRGHDEERFLFAQLLSASPEVTLSWHTADDEGRDEPPSPLVERLLLARTLPAPEDAPGLAAPASGGARPAHERAVLAGLAAGHTGLAVVLPVALAEAGAGAAAAAARLAVLDELDPDRRTAAGRARFAMLGPYLGFVGTAAGADPRAGDPAVTTLEALARCGWQTFLRRLLRVEPPPDPLAGVPAFDAALVGGVVHTVLQRVVEGAAGVLPSGLAEALAGTPRPVPWPSAAALDELLAGAAGEAARGAGLLFPGFAALLARQARALLEAAACDWEGGGRLPVLGAEVEGRFEPSAPAGRRVTFRADRVERLDDRVRLTDYKSGPVALPAGDDSRRGQLLRGVARGERLQAAVYALAAGGRAEGRYLFLGANPEARPRGGSLDSADPGLAPALAAALATLFAAWERGAFVPRLEAPASGKEPRACEWCEVAQACLRRDSGARRRLAEWAGRAGDAPAPEDEAAAALLALWRLPLAQAGDGPPPEGGA